MRRKGRSKERGGTQNSKLSSRDRDNKKRKNLRTYRKRRRRRSGRRRD